MQCGVCIYKLITANKEEVSISEIVSGNDI